MTSNLDQLVALLDRHKHWSISVVNERGQRKAYSCTIWGDGKRVTAQRQTPLLAGQAALEKLREKTAPKLKVVKQ